MEQQTLMTNIFDHIKVYDDFLRSLKKVIIIIHQTYLKCDDQFQQKQFVVNYLQSLFVEIDKQQTIEQYVRSLKDSDPTPQWLKNLLTESRFLISGATILDLEILFAEIENHAQSFDYWCSFEVVVYINRLQQFFLDLLLDHFDRAIAMARNYQQVIEIKNKWFKHFFILDQALKEPRLSDKKNISFWSNHLKKGLTKKLQTIKQKFDQTSYVRIDPCLRMENEAIKKPHPHWLNHVVQLACDWFEKLSFKIEFGNEVVSTFENFDLLNIKPNHPARLNSDAFYFKQPPMMLRSHNTANTAKVLLNNKEKTSMRVVTFGNVYRNDPDDATHSHQFMQIDFIWVQRNINLMNLKWVIKSFLNHIFERAVPTRFRPSFFPFTEPSFEVDIGCIYCNMLGCSICKRSGWIEVLGAGMLHQTVLANTGYDPDQFQAIAAGIGCERIAMIKHKITDIRHFYQNNSSFFEK